MSLRFERLARAARVVQYLLSARCGSHARIVVAAAALAASASIAAAPATMDDSAPLDAALHETVVHVPMTVQGLLGSSQRELVATIWQPDGPGPFPFIVLSHGSPVDAADRVKVGRYRKVAQIRALVRMGFLVIVPIRRGYGDTGGTYAEDAGSCRGADYVDAGKTAAQDLLATVAYADTLPQVDKTRLVLVGQSAGGFASLAAASYNPPGLIAVVNFSGGRGGDPVRHPGQPCAAENMAKAMGYFASTTHVPVLWHYVENDKFFAPEVVRSWFAAFQAAGGQGELVMEPPFGDNGHVMFSLHRSIPIWLPHVQQFLGGVPALHLSGAAGSGVPSATAKAPADSDTTPASASGEAND